MSFFRRTKKASTTASAAPAAPTVVDNAPAGEPVATGGQETSAPASAAGSTIPRSPVLDKLLQPVANDQHPLPFDAEANAEEASAAGGSDRALQKRKLKETNLGDLRKMGLPRAVIRQGGPGSEREYDYTALYTGDKVTELWHTGGDTLIFLCSKGEKRNPSFFVSSHVLISKSEFFMRAISPNWQMDHEIDTESYPGAKYSLYFGPDKTEDRMEETDPLKLLRHYIIIRNVFGCMFDSTCVELEGDERLLTDIADRMLMYFEGSDIGVAQELGSFIQRSGLWDVRNDPVKALDLLIFAYQYKIEKLYKEAFIHVVGMLPRVKKLETWELLEDGSLMSLIDDAQTIMNAHINMAAGSLHDFSFKRMWSPNAPIYNAKGYIAWRKGYEDFRKFLYAFYTDTEGSNWKSQTITRSVTAKLQNDFAALYDLLVNRTLTTHDAASYHLFWKDYTKVLAAHDKSLNDQPCIPYGICRLPGPAATVGTTSDGPDYSKDKLTVDLAAIELTNSYNTLQSNKEPIVIAFKSWEKKIAAGKKMKEIVERRRGYWLVIYAVLSSLAEVVVEDDVKFTEDVEYFLCCDTRNITRYWEYGDGEEDGEASGSFRVHGVRPAGTPSTRKNNTSTAATAGTTATTTTDDNTSSRRCTECHLWKVGPHNW